ncbi:MAG: PD40 domain-containing protein [Bacteroidales bacterium]|nr:PD40 domain-containing protein [Bacteroidales bacterium]
MKKLLALIFLITIFFQSYSQRDSVLLAEELIYNQDFNSAIVFYKQLISMDPKNPDYYGRLGFCYLNSVEKRDSAMAPYKKAIELYDDLSRRKRRRVMSNPLELQFYLARSYRVNLMFDSAIIELNSLKTKTKNRKILKLIDNEINLCVDGQELMSHPVDIVIKNLEPNINTAFTEHTPVFSLDETELIFTSRKKLNNNSVLDYDNEYDENIYISKKDSAGNWLPPEPISNINTPDHEATISMSHDQSKLFIYKDEDEGSIYYSNFSNRQWQTPIKMGPTINTKYRETHASLSYDGTTLFFTSNRPGGYGGMDIYITKLMPDGKWGPAVNVGPGINTNKDEESPYILPDGKTLYFSSRGHGGLGGFDIFKTNLNDFGTWTMPENIGYPINSIDDDVFFFPTFDEQRAYFASKNGDNNYGSSDIYLMKLPEINNSPYVIMTGKLSVCEGDLPPADIQIIDNTTDNFYIATPKDEKFVFVTQKDHNYTVVVLVNEQEVFSETFDVDPNSPKYMIYKVIKLDPDVKCDNIVTLTDDDLINPKRIGPNGNIFDYFVEIDNILFPLNGVGQIFPNSTLDTLVSFLNRNPEAIIEVGGYCDASGRASYNQILGQRRADAVKSYLVSHGVDANQVVAIGYGEENPIAINKNADGTWNRDGQKLNRRVEFKLIEQGDETLLIWGMKIPDNLKNSTYKFTYQKAATNNAETTN